MGLAGVVLAALLLGGSDPSRESLYRADRPARYGDFASYYVAGRAFLEGKSPFDPETVRALAEREDLTQVFVVWNPPFFLPIIAPFAALPFEAGAMLWLAMNLFLVIGSGIYLGRQAGIGDVGSVVLTMTFVPVACCLGLSQWSILLLSAFVVYLHFLKGQWFVLAGMALGLGVLKPHLFALVWLVPLLAGDVRSRLQRIAGIGITLGVLGGGACFIQPGVFEQYLASYRDPPGSLPTNYLSATSAMGLRLVAEHLTGSSPQIWAQFAPVALAMFVSLWWLWRRAPVELNRDSETLLLMSMIVLPYGWHYDQVLLLPTFLMLWGEGARRGGAGWWIMLSLILSQVVLLGELVLGAPEFWFWWTPVALGFLWQGTRGRRKSLSGVELCPFKAGEDAACGGEMSHALSSYVKVT